MSASATSRPAAGAAAHPRSHPAASALAGAPAAPARLGRPRRRERLAGCDRPGTPGRRRRPVRPLALDAAGPGGPRDLPRRAVRGSPGVRRHGAPHGPGPAAGRRDARRDQPAADGAAAAGPRRAGFFGAEGLGQVQLVWLLLSLAVATTLAIVVRSDSWLRQYKYTWAAAGIALLLLTFVLGSDVGGQRLTLVDRPVQRAAVGAAQGDPRRVPRRVPLGEPRAARRAGHADRAAPPPAHPVPRADGRDVGHRPRHRRGPARPRRRVAVLRRVPAHALRRDGPDQPRHRRPGGVLRRQRGPRHAVRAHRDADRHLARSLRGSARCRLPGRPVAARVRPGRAARDGPRQRAAADRRTCHDPGGPHRLPAGGARRGAGADRRARRPRDLPGDHRARPAHRRGGRGRLPVAARHGPRAGRRDPGIHHRRRQPQGPAAHRGHVAIHQLRRLIAARERPRHRAAARAV